MRFVQRPSGPSWLSTATTRSRSSSAAAFAACEPRRSCGPLSSRSSSMTCSTASVSWSRTSQVSSPSSRHRSAKSSWTTMSPSLCFSAKTSGRSGSTWDTASRLEAAGSMARTPTRMTHSRIRSSSEKPIISSLLSSSIRPPWQSSAQGTSSAPQSRAASVPISSTTTSGLSEAHSVASCTSSWSQAAPLPWSPSQERKFSVSAPS
mmetsp:Transcript_63642/g.114564  ORF Transcript_63642/g.114564 Transcript_63642/m.114564 type:complete len:206 (-) Transcript_63642:1744-2361(-)